METSRLRSRSTYASWKEGFCWLGAHELCCVNNPCLWPFLTHEESFMHRIHRPGVGRSSALMSKLRITRGKALPSLGIVKPTSSSYF